MSIHAIYYQGQRERIEKWLKPLVDDGWQFELAPLGLQSGSKEWVNQVAESIQKANLVLVFLTSEASEDGSYAFSWRLHFAVKQRKRLVPILLDNDYRPQLKAIENSQYIMGNNKGRDSLREILTLYAKRIPKCFISYSHRDTKFAVQLAKDLKQSDIQVWRDEEDISAGSAWDSDIQNAIHGATHVLLVFSETALSSKTVMDEVSYALDKNKIVVPCMIEKTELPLRVRRNQWVDFTGDYDTALKKLVEQLRKWGEKECEL